MKKSFFRKRKVIAGFAVIALIGGFFFLNNKITGNVIVDYEKSVNLISIIGLLLIACSVILAFYAIGKK